MTWLTDALDADHATCRAADQHGIELAGRLNAVNGELTKYVAELLETGAWVHGAVTTPSAFLQWKLGLSPARADDIVDVAAKRGDDPILVASFDRGELSLEQVVAALRAPSYADQDIRDLAQIATVTKIRRFVRTNTPTGRPTAERSTVVRYPQRALAHPRGIRSRRRPHDRSRTGRVARSPVHRRRRAHHVARRPGRRRRAMPGCRRVTVAS